MRALLSSGVKAFFVYLRWRNWQRLLERSLEIFLICIPDEAVDICDVVDLTPGGKIHDHVDEQVTRKHSRPVARRRRNLRSTYR